AGLVLKYVIANRQPNMAMAGNYGMQQPFTQPGVPQGAVQCPKCGKQIAPNAKFCPGCGNKMM
ncbi:MAG: zinc-ribbon domain-containing protein, partial [Oscillospiraceae bacterium]|nr:zinc-ribbon domain-containing protein [Oscillospiraceae bacterium]